jgi:hypothetical protein
MSQSTEVRLVDDLDGSEATATVGFALHGRGYEIELSDDNQKRLEAALEPFIAAARRVRKPEGFKVTPRRLRQDATDPGFADGSVIRRWAREQGLAVSERGKISHSVRRAYNTAHGVPVNEDDVAS